MEEQAIKTVTEASSTLIEQGVLGAVALIVLAGSALLVRFVIKDAGRREGQLLESLRGQKEVLKEQTDVLRGIHNEQRQHRAILEEVRGRVVANG